MMPVYHIVVGDAAITSTTCRGAALEAMNDMKGALEDYKAVVDLNPGVADAAAGLKRCQAALGIVPSQSGAVTKSRSGGSGSGSGKLGEEDAKMLEEAEGRVKEVARQKQKAQEQERTAKAEKRRAELTLNQLQSLAEDRTMYKGVGKVFVKAPKADIVSQLSTTSSKADQKLKVCQSTLDYLSKQEKEADDQFVEILGTIRRKMGVKA